MEALSKYLEKLKIFEALEDLINVGRELSDLKIEFEDHLIEKERVHQIAMLDARDKGEEFELIDFSEIKNAFREIYKKIQSIRKQQIALKETLEKENLKLKKNLLEDLKKVIEAEENINTAFHSYKEIHETWKKIGDIPREHRDSIQKEYSRLLEIFFYTMRIYREIKDHDYKRNFQLKQNVIHRLQQLRNSDSPLSELEQILKSLQNEWEDIGPVLNHDWESLKASYWETVRSIYDKINTIYESQRQVLVHNIEEKRKIVSQLISFKTEALTLNSQKSWDQLTQKVIELQNIWKKIGPGSRKENEEIWKEFRTNCDEFFESKKAFSKEQMDHFNVFANQKREIIKKIVSLQGSTNWKNTKDTIVQLQKDWKNIGYAGNKLEHKLWTEFRTACDTFFNAKDQAHKELDLERVENQKAKEALIEQINQINPEDKKVALQSLRELADSFNKIGSVPHENNEKIYKAYKKALDDKYNALSLEANEKSAILYKSKLDSILASKDRSKLLQKEKSDVRRQIDKINQEIILMENNIGFFANSKGAEALKAEVDKKVKTAQKEIELLKQKLKLIPNE